MPNITPAETMEGGCACGAVRYRLTGPLADVGYCHCRLCQKASGAPVMVFGSVEIADFAILAGDPARRRSSEMAERWFCRDCGSQLAFVALSSPQTVDIAVATLDDPAPINPEFHIWESSGPPWFHVEDTLPRHAAGRST